MYKYRLKAWNLQKYGRKEQGSSSSSKAEKPRSMPRDERRIPLIVPVKSARHKEIYSGMSLVHHTNVLGKRGRPVTRQQTRTTLQHRITAPERLRLPEEVMVLSQQLGCGLTDLGLWAGKSDIGKMESNKWWGRTILATQFFDLKKYKQAFDTLNSSFDQFTTLLQNPDPGLLQGAYLVILQLEPFLGQRFLDFTVEMAAIKLPPKHPLRILLSRLRDAGVMQLRNYAQPILESYLGVLEKQLGSANSGVLVLYENLYDTLDFLSHEKKMNFVDSVVIQSRQLHQVQRLEHLGLISQAQSARLALAYTYWRHDLVKKAEYANYDVLEWLQTHPKDQHSKDLDLWDSLYLRFRCKEKIGTVEDVTRVGEEYIETLRSELGPDHRRTIAAIGHLQKYYRDNGYTEEAEELESAINAPTE